jgi:(S)-2-hydroxyglutarate dehydrogenase
MSTSSADVVVIGAGILGLATAERITRDRPSISVHVIEAESGVAVHQTGHNSGVLHSGLYYKPGSLKARLAVQGRSDMVAFCREHEIDHDVCGKVVVATRNDELERLDALFERGRANNVRVERIDVARLAELEPHCAGIAALLVPDTGIVNYRQVCERLAELVVDRGAQISFGHRVRAIDDRADGATIETDSMTVQAGLILNCGGLRSDQVAGMVDAAAGHRIVPFRGEYYELIPERRHLVNNLIYPVPDPSFPFLGVHLTRMIDGSIHAGPNAVLALAREGYRWRDVDAKQLREHLTNKGLWQLARAHWKTGAGEIWRSVNKRAFVKALARLVPDIAFDDLEDSPAGVRAQAMDADGALVDDFAITSTANSVHVLNAPSPAATASLQIAGEIVDRIADRLS